jgi:phosphoglycolate phosphatase
MHVLVDLDGTLVDPKPGILGSMQYALRCLGALVPAIDELAWAIGPPLRTTFPKLLGGTGRTEQAVALYRENYRNGAMYDAVVYPGIPRALEALTTAGCRLIVATAKPHSFARPILEHFDLAHHFMAIYGPELDGTNDSKADLIAHIIDRERVKPDAAVMIGDRHMDVAAAARNGMRAIGVTWGYGSVDELTAAGAASLCAAPVDLASAALLLLGSLSKFTREIDPPVQLSHR